MPYGHMPRHADYAASDTRPGLDDGYDTVDHGKHAAGTHDLGRAVRDFVTGKPSGRHAAGGGLHSGGGIGCGGAGVGAVNG